MIRGWCPTVHAPMASGDGLLARVKPFGGRLSSAGLQALADAVAAFANGVVELTGRGNLQVRGLRDPAAFARATVAAGLADPDPDREARRNVVAVPPCDDALVSQAEAVLAQTPGLRPKFCLVVRGATVFLDGEAVARDGVELRRVLSCSSLTQPSLKGRGHFSSPSPLAGEGRGEGWQRPANSPGHLLHLPFGQTDAATLAQLGSLTPELRTTPWRAFLSPVAIPGFDHPSTLAACPGAPACGSGTVPARADAALLQAAGFANLHVSGCAKGCAHPRATTTLVGRDGRYDLVRHGRASDAPDLRGLTLTDAMAAL